VISTWLGGIYFSDSDFRGIFARVARGDIINAAKKRLFCR
jgi:hypothetical protein